MELRVSGFLVSLSHSPREAAPNITDSFQDATNPLPGPRLLQILSAIQNSSLKEDSSSPAKLRTTTDLVSKLTHFSIPTLPHLIALLCHSTSTFPPPSTSLIVIDSLSSLITSTYPRNTDSALTALKAGPSTTPSPRFPMYFQHKRKLTRPTATKQDRHRWAASRKWSVLQSIISSLQKLATLRNIAVVVLNQSATKIQSGSGAILVSGILSTAWDAGIAARIVLFRDWGWEGREVRFAAVLKAKGFSGGQIGRLITFVIGDVWSSPPLMSFRVLLTWSEWFRGNRASRDGRDGG